MNNYSFGSKILAKKSEASLKGIISFPKPVEKENRHEKIVKEQGHRIMAKSLKRFDKSDLNG